MRSGAGVPPAVGRAFCPWDLSRARRPRDRGLDARTTPGRTSPPQRASHLNCAEGPRKQSLQRIGHFRGLRRGGALWNSRGRSLQGSSDSARTGISFLMGMVRSVDGSNLKWRFNLDAAIAGSQTKSVADGLLKCTRGRRMNGKTT